ncbi:hypothetical protein AVEN_34662-1 [Araneus ventricosus]|uniref:Uncharacterized protein n=1 Tax=Araneus ventricosus TaxID=182803 RepID=A0A4Y2B0Y5_ARAVE|nr:hypothetical protein AVEN_34662-1 [Araneus ventricosus]
MVPGSKLDTTSDPPGNRDLLTKPRLRIQIQRLQRVSFHPTPPKIRYVHEDYGGLVVRSRLWGRRVPGLKLGSTEDPSCMWTFTFNPTPRIIYPPDAVVWEFGEEFPAQVTSSLS